MIGGGVNRNEDGLYVIELIDNKDSPDWKAKHTCKHNR